MLDDSDAEGRLRRRKTLALALAGTLLGVAASFLAWHYLEREESQFREALLAKHAQQEMAVVVAKADLPAGTSVDNGNMAIRRVPRDYVYPETVSPERFDQMRGEILLKPLRKGQPLLTGHLSESGAAGLAGKIQEGRRAVTINVDETSSLNGMIHPGDRIDLLFSARGGVTGSRLAPLLENVRVLATGRQFEPAPGKPGEDRFGLSYSTLTLDVPTEAAGRIVLARQAGVLTAVLRSRGDDGPGPHAVTSGDLLSASGEDDAPGRGAGLAGAPRPALVTYIMRGETPGTVVFLDFPVGDSLSGLPVAPLRSLSPVLPDSRVLPAPLQPADEHAAARLQKTATEMEQRIQ